MINSSMQKLNRVATSIVAAATLVLTTFAGALPASATVPTPNANSNVAATTINSNWTIGSASTTDLANANGGYWEANYEIEKDPNSAFALVGKTLTITGSVTGLPTGFSASVNLNLDYYNGSTWMDSGNASGTGTYARNNTVPTGATKVRMLVSIYLNGSTQFATIPTATMTPTFTLNSTSNGTTSPIVRDETYPYTGAATNLHLVEHPALRLSAPTDAFVGRSTYASAYTQVATCVDLANRTPGDQLTVTTVVDGAASSSGNVNYENLDSGANSGSGRTITLTSNQINSGEMLKVYHNQSDFADITTGNHTTKVSVTANGTEVSAPCVLKAPSGSAPVLSYDASNMNGPAGLFIQVSGSDYTNSWNWKIYRVSDNTLLSEGSQSGNSGPRPLYSPCGMNGCTPVAPAGVPVYAKVQTSKPLLYAYRTIYAYSALSAASNTSQFPNPWLTVTEPSAGSLPGDARLVGQNIDFAAADVNPDLMMPSNSLRTVSDGKNGVIKPNLKIVSGCMGPVACVMDLKLYRIGASGIDSSFGNAGATGLTVARYTSNAQGMGAFPQFVNAGWYGARNKWTVVSRDVDYSSMSPVTSFKIYTGTFAASTVSTPITITASQLVTGNSAPCAGFMAGTINPISAPTSAPLFYLNCSTSGQTYLNSTRVVTIASNGAITELARLSEGDGTTDASFNTFASISNVNASAASDVALTLIGYSASSAGNIVARKSVQFKVNGTANTVNTSPYASTATTVSGEKRYLFPVTAAGAATTGVLATTANGVTTYKLASLSDAGTITDGDDLPLDSVTGMDAATLVFVPGQEVGTTGKIQMIRSLGTTKLASITVDLDAKTTDTGEVVSYANSTDSRVVRFYFLDAQGRVNWMFSSGESKLSLIRWNGLSGGGALPDGVTVTSVSTKYITNAAAVVTITGTGLNLASASAKISVAGAGLSTQVAPSSKSATKIVLTVPTGTTAGDITLNAPLALGDATLATLTRVGATKQDQAITDTQDVQATWSGVGSKTTASFPATTDKGLATTIKVDKAAICSVSGQTVTMNAAGTCVVTVASAGDLGTNAASQTTTIVVDKRTQQINSIITLLESAGSTWNGSNQTVTIPSLLTSVGLTATVTVAPATVCTLTGAIITLKAAGTCVVSVTGAGDAGTDAVAKTVRNVIVAKGNMGLDVPSTMTVTNNPADSNNVQILDVSMATGAVAEAELTFASSNEDVCTVDENGYVTGVAVGTCVITTDIDGGSNWNADEATTTVTVEDSSTPVPDALAEVGDGDLSPKPIANNKNAFVATNDPSLLVKWDKVAGLLTLQSKGVYTGFIKAEFTFTKNGTTYTCTNVFGTTAAMASKTVAQRKAALKTKVYTAGSAACKDASGISVPGVGGVAGNLTDNFSLIKKVAKVAGNITTAGTKAYEAAAQTALKGFAGNVTIKITRYRAWPTTMKNWTPGTELTRKKIPATVRTTVIGLQ